MGARGCRGQAGTGAGPAAVVTARPVPAPRGVASWLLGQGPGEGLCKRGGKLQKAQTSESLFLVSSDRMSAACIRALPVLPWHFSGMENEAALLNSVSLRCFGLFYPDFLFVQIKDPAVLSVHTAIGSSTILLSLRPQGVQGQNLLFLTFTKNFSGTRL